MFEVRNQLFLLAFNSNDFSIRSFIYQYYSSLLSNLYRNEAKARNGTVDENFVMYEKDGSLMEPQMGCITDRLGDGAVFVAPIFAKFCSRHCYYLIPHNSIYYYDHEDINTAKPARRGRLEKLKQPAPPTKGDGAPRLSRVHVCPYEGFNHEDVDRYYTF